MKLKRFTQPLWLHSLGREALEQVFGKFAEEMAQRGKPLPASHLNDDAWYSELGFMLLAPESVPEELVETLFLLEEMATPEAHDRLLIAAKAAGLTLDLGEHATPGDVAIKVWLARPDLLVQKHNEARLNRLTAFEYFGAQHPRPQPVDFSLSPAAIAAMTADLDAWFRAHNRGRGTTHIDLCPLEDERLFVARHGDTYRRTAKVDHGRLEVLHFRPAKDDMVVYAPLRDEIRIHAGTKGEREAYRRAFGLGLHGSAHHFSLPQAYTLEPLRTQGRDALDPGRVPGIAATALTELEFKSALGLPETEIRKASCVFLAALARGRKVLPDECHLVRAVISFRFNGASAFRRVEIAPPNKLRLGLHCDPRLVHRWLVEQGFRVNRSRTNLLPH